MAMLQFEITLKNDKIKSYKLIALLLVLLNGAVFIFFVTAGVHFYESISALLLLIMYFGYLFYAAKKNKSAFSIKAVTFLILAGSWVMLHNYQIAFACMLLGFLYHLSLQQLQFIFSENFVRKMNIPQKKYLWETVDNVVLRDNILTIDLKDNTLIQGEIESDINETQFNAFAKQHLYHSHNSVQSQL
jgi:hypothetical protein